MMFVFDWDEDEWREVRRRQAIGSRVAELTYFLRDIDELITSCLATDVSEPPDIELARVARSLIVKAIARGRAAFDNADASIYELRAAHAEMRDLRLEAYRNLEAQPAVTTWEMIDPREN